MEGRRGLVDKDFVYTNQFHNAPLYGEMLDRENMIENVYNGSLRRMRSEVNIYVKFFFLKYIYIYINVYIDVPFYSISRRIFYI